MHMLINCGDTAQATNTEGKYKWNKCNEKRQGEWIRIHMGAAEDQL